MAVDPEQSGPEVLSGVDLVGWLRSQAMRRCRDDADRMLVIHELDSRVRACAAVQLADATPAARDLAAELLDDLVVEEVQAALGLSDGSADAMVGLALRAVRVLPRLVAQLRSGRLDLPRVRVLVEATAHLDDAIAAAVADTLVDQLARDGVTTPWDGPSPRTWKDRVHRAVVRADPDTARKRQDERIRARCVRTWSNGDGTGTLLAEGPAGDIIDIEQVIQQLAASYPQVDGNGTRLTMDQRRWAATVDVFRRIAEGRPLPTVSVRREREVGVVLAADVLFGDGPAAEEPGCLRGLGQEVVLDPATARRLAEADLARGRALTVLLTDDHGQLQHLIRLPDPPAGGWTRQSLIDAVRAALPKLPALTVPGYVPTTAIAEHVRAARPRCSGYDCARVSRRCDLDHDESWPRGLTSVTNLDPKCRRDHQYKTLGLWRTQLHPDGSVTWTSLLGTTVTTRHEPYPGPHQVRGSRVVPRRDLDTLEQEAPRVARATPRLPTGDGTEDWPYV